MGLLGNGVLVVLAVGLMTLLDCYYLGYFG